MHDRSDPYLRAAPLQGAPSPQCPDGWAAAPAGLWGGTHMEVVYNLRRHDVLIVRGRMSHPAEAALPSVGYFETDAAEGVRMFVRDRTAATRDALNRLEHHQCAAPELGRT